MSTPCVLTGGNFQDSEGNVLANGYLEFVLSQDGAVSGVGNICAGIAITITLDSTGNVAATQTIWGNDVILPTNTFYRVTGFTAEGQPAWGPNNQQVVGSTFDLGSWIPNQIISWTPSTSAISLNVNGTLASSQNRQNLQSQDDSVTITDLGGGNIDFHVDTGGGGISTPGAGWFIGPGIFQPVNVNPGSGASVTSADNVVRFLSFVLPISVTIRTCTVRLTAGLGSQVVGVGIYDINGNAVLRTSFTLTTTSPVTNTFSPVTLPAGVYFLAQSANPGPTTSCISVVVSTDAYPVINAVNPSYGHAANVMSAGVMPATLGALTGDTANSVVPIAAVFTP